MTIGPAAAHIGVAAPSARQGSTTTLTFQVISESSHASTTAVKILMPARPNDLTDVTVPPHPGWSVDIQPTAQASVGQITWTALDPASALAPGDTDEFQVRATLPRASQVAFRAIQTYSDGEVVRWIQPTVPGGAEPENPAPVLLLFTDAELRAAQHPPTPATRSEFPLAWVVTGAGAAAGLAALAAIVLVRRRNRRSAG